MICHRLFCICHEEIRDVSAAVGYFSSAFRWVWLTLEQPDGSPMPPMMPGQFVEIGVDRQECCSIVLFQFSTALKAPLSCLWLGGRATKVLAGYVPGDSLRVVAPLGKGFAGDFEKGARVLLVGGGVGIAPLYYQARLLAEAGCTVEVIFGMRTAPDSAIVDRFASVADIKVCTDDGTAGFHGLVTRHPDFSAAWDYVQVCGPKPMMMAARQLAMSLGYKGEVSLENMMACGLGACLCCVEKLSRAICVSARKAPYLTLICSHGRFVNIAQRS